MRSFAPRHRSPVLEEPSAKLTRSKKMPLAATAKDAGWGHHVRPEVVTRKKAKSRKVQQEVLSGGVAGSLDVTETAKQVGALVAIALAQLAAGSG